MIERLLTQEVTILPWAPTASDEYGDEVPAWGTARAVKGRLEQAVGRELDANRSTLIGEWRLFLAAGDPIAGRDRVQSDGVTYEVDGPPARPWAPRGEHHVEARLRVVEG